MTDIIESTPFNNLSAVARRLYADYYKDARRPDGSRVWTGANGVINVLSKACADGQMNCLKLSNRRVYVLTDDAKFFMDDYLARRINSQGMTQLELADVTEEEDEGVGSGFGGGTNQRFGWLARRLGVDQVYFVLKDISSQLLRIQQRVEELKKLWQ